jgi:hypothetical protein
MDDDGRLVVREPAADTHRMVVEYADELVFERLQNRPPGATVRLELASAPDRPDSFVATRVLPGGPLAL